MAHPRNIPETPGSAAGTKHTIATKPPIGIARVQCKRIAASPTKQARKYPSEKRLIGQHDTGRTPVGKPSEQNRSKCYVRFASNVARRYAAEATRSRPARLAS
jgi:hypothetical protein